ncbi:synaptotagmin-like protein 2 isoform X2 [Etheostoma spectabile]|uniref:synaptotagmin-like protein 2 isoform X2 n=1 Tax=Etheostoma spectabile TaxID=54343 RepID=UPI0013AFA474|nr:synaptotagmin-like protein 2 isoform X2 [Etheostoma spectabile]
MIDLSFLTEEEQEAILAVLRRDAELKKAEEQRVQNLQKTAIDKDKLRYMTGEWFYETKQLRHQDRIHGSEIIRASMRHSHKPLTTLELSRKWPEKPNYVSSENKDEFVLPVLCGEPEYQNQKLYETPQESPESVLQSPTKQRKNPFNSDANHPFEEKDSQLLDGAVDQTQILTEEPLPSSDSCISYARNIKQDLNDSPNASVPMPMPENTEVITSSQDCFVEEDGQGDQQTNTAAPRGILKHLFTSSSTDSLFSHLDLQSPVSLDSLPDTWIDRKQVRFSSTVGWSGVEWQDGKELGEHSMLDVDSITPSELENNSDFDNTGSTTVGTLMPLPKQNQADSQEGELNCKDEESLQEKEAGQHPVLGDVSEHCRSEVLSHAVPELVSAEQESGQPVQLETEPEEEQHSQAEAPDWPTGHNIHPQKLPEQRTDISIDVTSDTKPSNGSSKGSAHAVSPKPRHILEKEQTAEVQSPQKEDIKKVPKQKEPGNTQNLSQGAANVTVEEHASVKQEAKPSEMTEVRPLPLTALQNTPFTETVTLVDTDPQQEATEGRVVQLPEKLSNLKAFWERENSGPKIIFTREETRSKDITKRGIEASLGCQTISDVKSINNNISPQMEMTVEDAVGMFQEKSLSPKTDHSFLIDLSKEDGTYRANPVLIYEETDDSLTGSVTESQISEPQENIMAPVPSTVAFNTQKQESDIPVHLPRHSGASPPEDRSAKISEVMLFWEKEYTGPRVIAARVKEASHSSTLRNKVISSQIDLRTSIDNREKSGGEAQESSSKSKSNVVLKSLKVTDKGFVTQSPDRSQLRSLGSTGDVQSTCYQSQVKANLEHQERPLSPSKSKTPRSKDQEEEVRRSPSKTCHPRVLPKESSSPQKSKLEGSPLKTFSIDINPQTKVVEEQEVKPTPVPIEKKSPSHEAKQIVRIDTNPSTDVTFRPLPLLLDDRAPYFGNVNTQQSSLRSFTLTQSKKASEKKLGTFTRLARSLIPQDYQHYLGPQEKAHVPPFHQDKAVAAEKEVEHKPQNALRDYVGNQRDSPTVGNPPGVTSLIVQNKDGYSIQNTTTRAWSLSRANSGSHDDSSSPIISALKRLSSRNMSSSKSLENLTSQTISLLPPSASTLPNSKQMKSSVSVTVLQQDETDSDHTLETILGWRRNTGSSTSNLSLSSGMASMSSVSGSMSSIHPADLGDVEVQGSIQFAVNYIQKLGEFHIFVVNCRDLAMAETKKNCTDPYVKCYLLPDKTKLGKRKTVVKKKTLNPIYNEILCFKITMEVLKTENLNISVWHNNTFGWNSFLGEVNLDLSEWDFSNTHINEFPLKARVSAQSPAPSPLLVMHSRGQMRVALRFLPQTSHSKRTSRLETGEVQIWVKDCKNLPPVRGVIIDPFVKCTVLPDTSRRSRQKTRVVKRTANPMFNHTMVYDGFRPEDLREACVEITVWDHDRLNNHYIGGLRLGLGTGKSYGLDVVWMDSMTDEANLWQRMLQSDGEWVEDVLPLRMLIMAKSMSK